VPSAAQHHNNKPRPSESLTLRRSIRCRPATTEEGNRILSEIYLVNRPLPKLYAHPHSAAGVPRPVVLGQLTNPIALGLCGLGMHLTKVVFANCSKEQISWERGDILGVPSIIYFISGRGYVCDRRDLAADTSDVQHNIMILYY